MSKSLQFFKKGLAEILSITTDIELVYYALFWILAIYAICAQPLCLAFHMSIIIIRSSIIKDLLGSIFSVLHKLFFAVIALLLAVYWFTIWSFNRLQGHYKNETCNTLLKCFVSTFTENFKQNGGVGPYLDVFKAYGSGPGIDNFSN